MGASITGFRPSTSESTEQWAEQAKTSTASAWKAQNGQVLLRIEGVFHGLRKLDTNVLPMQISKIFDYLQWLHVDGVLWLF
jgi:hypothetical protein